MRANEFIPEYKADNDINNGGLGVTGYNANVAYQGIRILMRPSIFLKLALPLARPTSVDHIVQHMKNGGSLGSPFIIVEIPEDWFDGNFDEYARVTGHEGRNRMMAIQKVEGDTPCEVHLFGRGGLRARHFTKEILERLAVGLRNEKNTEIVFADGGKLFEPM
jgi:hypothetical protein